MEYKRVTVKLTLTSSSHKRTLGIHDNNRDISVNENICNLFYFFFFWQNDVASYTGS